MSQNQQLMQLNKDYKVLTLTKNELLKLDFRLSNKSKLTKTIINELRLTCNS